MILYQSSNIYLFKFIIVFLLYFSCEVAKNIPADSYALVFGVNTFMALVVQTLLTVIVNSPMGLTLNIRTQVK